VSQVDLSKWLEVDLYPKVYEQLDHVFPEFGWKREGDHWVATNNDVTKNRLPGGPAARRVYAYANTKHGFVMQGNTPGFWTWLQYRSGGVTPRGKQFIAEVANLAKAVGISLPDEGHSKPGVAKDSVLGNPEWHQRQVARLWRNQKAVEWLTKARKFPESIIKSFGLGLTPPARGRDYTDALVFPRVNPAGQFVAHYFYYDVPGVTAWAPGSKHRKGWGTAPVRWYYSGPAEGKTTLLLVEGFKDLWAIQTLLETAPDLQQQILVITGTHGVGNTMKAPEAQTGDFWRRWDQVILGFDDDEAGNSAASALVSLIPREVKIGKIPERLSQTPGKRADWNDLLLSGNLDDFRLVIEQAKPQPIGLPGAAPAKVSEEEVDPQIMYHNGYYYWPFEQLVQGVKDGAKAEEYRGFVLRSDGAILTVVKSPRLSHVGREVLRLSDGTPIRRYARPLRAGETSWEVSSIIEFAEAALARRPLQLPPFRDFAEKIRMHLKARVWLPYEEDYVVLALQVLASYAQEIFAAVPLVLLVGPPGTGKTELVNEAAILGCNGRALGKTTLAALMETCDRCRGLVTIDDFEEVGPDKGGRKAEQINQYQQVIKLSYKKSSGTQIRMGEDGQIKLRNIYGAKILNNTRGVDEITGTRVFTIHTRHRTQAKKVEMEQLREFILAPSEIRQLRNQVHQWVFGNVKTIQEVYQAIMADKVERTDEISAPLRTLANFAEDQSISDQLEKAIGRRDGSRLPDEEQAFIDALKAIVEQGHRHINAQHLINEIKKVLGADWGRSNACDIPEWQQPKYITAKLINDGWVNPRPLRPRIKHEIEVRIRTYELQEDRLLELIKSIQEEGKDVEMPSRAPGSFCAGCVKCDYKSDCSLLRRGQKPGAEL